MDDKRRMIEINYSKPNPQGGMLKGTMRIIGTNLFLLTVDNPYTQEVVNNLVNKGARITKDLRNRWIKVDIFSGQESKYFKLGGHEFNIDEVTDMEVEKILGEFYFISFTKAGFKCQYKNE
jgi:hypothetical protein